MGTGQLWATAQCAKQDFAELLRQLGDEENATAAKIVLICDKLNTYGPNVLYERNVPPEACQLVERFEPHYAREHDRWLNMVEIEPSVLERQCLRRRNASNNLLIVQTGGWERERNRRQAKTRWQFTTADARIKLLRLYPVIKPQFKW